MVEQEYYRNLYGEKIDDLMNTGKTLEETYNGLQGSKVSEPKQYSSNPDYDSVDSELFSYLDALDHFFKDEVR